MTHLTSSPANQTQVWLHRFYKIGKVESEPRCGPTPAGSSRGEHLSKAELHLASSLWLTALAAAFAFGYQPAEDSKSQCLSDLPYDYEVRDGDEFCRRLLRAVAAVEAVQALTDMQLSRLKRPGVLDDLKELAGFLNYGNFLYRESSCDEADT